MQIDAILFDWGGTLARVDNEAEALRRGAAGVLDLLIGQSSPELVELMATAAISAERQAAAGPEYREVSLRELIRDWSGRYGVPVADGKLDAAMDLIGRHWIGVALTVMPGVVETLQCLRDRGYRLGLVSNCFIPPEYCMEELRHQKIAGLLDSATFSSGVGYRKPSPRIYEVAARTFFDHGGAVDYTRILFVGDSPAYDVIGPASMGMKTALISNSTVPWASEDYELARPDFRVDSITELPGLLAG